MIVPRGPFSLAAARNFLTGFAAAEGTAAGEGDTLRLAFRDERTWKAAVVTLTQTPEGVRVESNLDVEAQLRRMLALDVDATPFYAIEDPPVRQMQEERPGFRMVSFPSPYEAGVWGLLTQRISMVQAARLRRLVSEPVQVGPDVLHVPLHPERMLDLEDVPGLPRFKLHRLQALAEAALAGRLDIGRLDPDALRTLPGVGPWTASLILTRGTGDHDALPVDIPRIVRALAEATGSPPEHLPERAERWRPFRMWVCMLAVLRMSRWND